MMEDRREGLPSGWAEATIGDIRHDRSQAIVPSKHPDDPFELYSVPAFESGTPEMVLGREIGSNKQTVESGSVILCKINPRINRVWVVGSHSPHRKIASTEWIPFSPVNGISPKYLCYFMRLNEFRDFLATRASGVGGSLMRVKASVVANYSFPLAPTGEQHRIVAKIEEQFARLVAAVGALKRVQSNLKRYRASVLKAACAGRLVPTEAELARREGRSYETGEQLLARILKERRAGWEADHLAKMKAAGKPPTDDKWKAKYQEPAAPDTSGIPQLPDGWVWATLEQLAERVTKGSSPGWQGFAYQRDGVRFLRSQNVRWGRLDLSDLAFLPKEFNLTHRHSIVREGDVLLNLVGASVGRSAIATHEVDGANTNQAVGIIRVIQGGLINSLLTHILISPYGQAHITQAKADVARANFNLDDIRLMPVPLPPLTEQPRIVAEIERRLSQIDELESMVNTGLKRGERLRQSILKCAFEGKLVPQDPSDEPASALLERIRAERAKMDEKGRSTMLVGRRRGGKIAVSRTPA